MAAANHLGIYMKSASQTRSTLFRPPPLDSSLTTAEWFEWHAQHNPDHPAFVYEDPLINATRTVYFSDVNPAIHRAGRYVQKAFGLAEYSDPSDRPVIGLLANSDAITYTTTGLGIIRAEASTFVISPRNSAPAIAHLLSKTNTKYLLITEDMQNLAANAIHSLELKPQIFVMPGFKDLYPEKDVLPKFLPPLKHKNPDAPVFILHSSGSTSFPKPISWSHSKLQQASRSPYYGERDLRGVVISAHALPAFHGMGVTMMSWMATCGATIATFKPTLPPTNPTPDLVYSGAVSTNSDIICCVPLFIETWSRDPEQVKHLKTIVGLLSGGARLNDDVGDSLCEQGVSIFQLYGTTEATVINEPLPLDIGKDWSYIKFDDRTPAHFIPDGHYAYELVLATNDIYAPCVVNTKIESSAAYATGDLFIPHPTRVGYWKFHGRADDQIMHNSGEKTNPVPLGGSSPLTTLQTYTQGQSSENILNTDPRVKSALMFGRSKFNAGVIIDPNPQYQFDPSDMEKLAQFRNEIWPTVEVMNAHAPQHSRIFKEMITVSSPHKPFFYTPKLTPRRQLILDDYASEIEALYAAADESAMATTFLPSSWTLANSLEFVRSVVGNVLKERVTDHDDFFQHSCDSLQATWIRNSILHALRKTTDINTREIKSSFVYQHPSISLLGRFVAEIATSGVSYPEGSKVDEMLNMVAKYSKDFGVHKGTASAPVQDVVLITGTSGGIGSNVLAELFKCSNVAKIFALTRKADVSSTERQKKALESRGLDPDIVNSPRIAIVDGDLTQTRFGLAPPLFDEIRSSVTHIIHLAWRVDFNLSLQSFEANVQSVRHLIDLALSSPLPTPPRLLFTSTISVLCHYSKQGPAPEVDVEPEIAVGAGYGESKWVSEKILSLARSETTLRPVVIRVGQVSGGVNGCWNPAEWIPSIVQSGSFVNCLPSLEKRISLLSLDTTASAIVQVRDCSADILHLTHPKPVSWNAIFRYISTALDIPLVPYSEWLSSLEAVESERAVEENCALRLLDFFKMIRDEDDGLEASGFPALATDIARKVCPLLRDENLKQVGPEDVQKWLTYWKNVGVIKV